MNIDVEIAYLQKHLQIELKSCRCWQARVTARGAWVLSRYASYCPRSALIAKEMMTFGKKSPGVIF